ncbi:MAG TPA: methyltransferase domain-containing protein [Patescibacteria group bacterium]
MEYIIRNTSIITGKKNLEHLLSFKNFPVFIGATTQLENKDFFADLSFSIDKDSGIIQLDKLVSPDIIYSEYHSEALGKTWENHHREFIKFISKYKFSSVLEIGGSNGSLAKAYIKNYKIKKWTIVEPNPTITSTKIIEVIQTLFDEHTKIRESVDVVIHSHVLEHIYSPRDFLSHISKFLEKGKYHIFSVPNLYMYLKNKQSNTINFEHTILLTEYFIDYLLPLYGFKVIKKKRYFDHSIFYSTKKVENKIVKKVTLFCGENKYEEYKYLFLKAVAEVDNFVDKINDEIKDIKEPVYLFGAHVFSQMLIYRGISKKVIAVLDNSAIKQGKRLYGTNKIILSPEVIRSYEHPTVVLRIGSYQNEVREQLRKINRNVNILE